MEIKLNTPCDIYSNKSMQVIRNVKIYKHRSVYVFYEEIYNSWENAPSQRATFSGRFKKDNILLIKYHTT